MLKSRIKINIFVGKESECIYRRRPFGISIYSVQELMMEFQSAVRLAAGSCALLLALIAALSSGLVSIAMVKNPLHVALKPVDRIIQAMIALSFFAGTMFLPFFGITEILRSTDDKLLGNNILASFVSIVANFLITSKLSIQFLFQFERHIAYVRPHFHRVRFTMRTMTLASVFLIIFALLLSLLDLSGIHKQIYCAGLIHIFASCTWLALIAVTRITYRNLKYRKTKVGPNEVSDLPHLQSRVEMEKTRNALGARKFLLQFLMWYSSFFFSLLPWYIVNFIGSVRSDLLESKMGFFWQTFYIPFALVTDAIVPIYMIIKSDYARTIRIILRCN